MQRVDGATVCMSKLVLKRETLMVTGARSAIIKSLITSEYLVSLYRIRDLMRLPIGRCDVFILQMPSGISISKISKSTKFILST